MFKKKKPFWVNGIHIGHCGNGMRRVIRQTAYHDEKEVVPCKLSDEQKQILNNISVLWNKYPQLRFFQLVNLLKSQDDAFYQSDNETLIAFEKWKKKEL